MYIDAKPELFRLASRMRKKPTEAEQVLWKYTRKYRSGGFVFRRQHPIDFFIADFYCHKVKLVIEVDGEIHADVNVREYDENRSGELEKFGITVIRFRNEEILNNIEHVLSIICLKIDELASPAHNGSEGREAVRLVK